MESLYLLIPLSLVLVFFIGGIFLWASRNGQFDDMEGPAYRILLDDDTPNDHLNSAALHGNQVVVST